MGDRRRQKGEQTEEAAAAQAENAEGVTEGHAEGLQMAEEGVEEGEGSTRDLQGVQEILEEGEEV